MSPTRYIVYPHWWRPGSALPTHVYSLNSPHWWARTLSKHAGASAWGREVLQALTDGDVHTLDSFQQQREEAGDTWQPPRSVAATAELAWAGHTAHRSTASLLRGSLQQQLHTLATGHQLHVHSSTGSGMWSPTPNLGGEAELLDTGMDSEEVQVGETFFALQVPVVTSSPFQVSMPREGGQPHHLAGVSPLAQLAVQAVRREQTRQFFLYMAPRLENCLQVTAIVPMDPWKSDVSEPTSSSLPPTLSRESAEWIQSWLQQCESRLGPCGAYGPLWVWGQEARASASAPSVPGADTFTRPEQIPTSELSSAFAVMHELRGGLADELQESPLHAGDLRGQAVPPPPRTFINFTDTMSVKVAGAGLAVRFMKLWQDEMKAIAGQVLAARNGRNLWMASSLVAPTASWMKMSGSATGVTVIIPQSCADPTSELVVTFDAVAAANRLEKLPSGVHPSARYPQRVKRHSISPVEGAADRRVRVVMDEAEASASQVLMETFDVVLNGMVVELHCLRLADAAVTVQPLGLAASMQVSLSNPASMAERFASAVDTALELTVTSSAGASLMMSSMQGMLALVNTNLREQSCLLHMLPLVDSNALDKHIQVLMPGDAAHAPIAVISPPLARRVQHAVQGTRATSVPWAESAAAGAGVRTAVPPSTQQGDPDVAFGAVHVLDFLPFAEERIPHLPVSKVAPLAWQHEVQAGLPRTGLTHATQTDSLQAPDVGRPDFRAVREGAALGTCVQVVRPPVSRATTASGCSQGVFRVLQHERRVSHETILRQYPRPFPEEYEWVWVSRPDAPGKLRLAAALQQGDYVSPFHGPPPDAKQPPSLPPLRRLLWQPEPRVGGAGTDLISPLSRRMDAGSPQSGVSADSPHEQAFSAPPSVDLHAPLQALLQSVAVDSRKVNTAGIEVSFESVLDTAGLVVGRAIQALQAAGGDGHVIQQLEAVQQAMDAATSAASEQLEVSEDTAADLAANNEAMARMLALRLEGGRGQHAKR